MDCLGNSFEEILSIVDKIDQKNPTNMLGLLKNEINGDLKFSFCIFKAIS